MIATWTSRWTRRPAPWVMTTRAWRRWSRSSPSGTSTTPTRSSGSTTSSRPCGRTTSTRTRWTTSSRRARSSSWTSSPAAHAGPALVRRPHQAVEAKEGVKIEAENQTLPPSPSRTTSACTRSSPAMTGTAETRRRSSRRFYDLDVVAVPHQPEERPSDAEDASTRPSGRIRRGLRRDRPAPREGAADPRRHRLGGEERGGLLLSEARRPHNVLNAKPPPAGGGDRRPGRAQGRGDHLHEHGRPRDDILLGGNPEMMAKHEVGRSGTRPWRGRRRRPSGPAGGLGRRARRRTES